MDDLWRVVQAMQRAAEASGVTLVTGDTKVVDRGKGDQIFINTSGIGLVPAGVEIRPDRARPGDKIIVNGPIAVHGMAIMSVREGLEFETQIRSDTAPLYGLVETILAACPDVHVLRDPTRGGVASAVNEIAKGSGTGILLEEEALPIPDDVRGACEMLGFDPLYVANEGKLLAFVPPGRRRRSARRDAESSARGRFGDHRERGGGSSGDRHHEDEDRREQGRRHALGGAAAAHLLARSCRTSRDGAARVHCAAGTLVQMQRTAESCRFKSCSGHTFE